jgi:hypothetical protein
VCGVRADDGARPGLHGHGRVAGGKVDLLSARASFERLGATPDLAEVDELLVAMMTDALP